MTLRKVASEIELGMTFLQGVPLSRFLEDDLLKRACCMIIINIGELIKNLSQETRLEYNHIPWKAIAGFRDIAAHKYQTLRMNDVYTTVISEFPTLKHQISTILNHPTPP